MLQRRHKKYHRYIRINKWLSQGNTASDPHGRRLPTYIRKIKKIAKRQLKVAGKYRKHKWKEYLDESEPKSFTARVILRARGRLPARRLVKLHQLYKDFGVFATYEWAVLRAGLKICLESLASDSPTIELQESIENLKDRIRNIVRVTYEEQLRAISQSSKIAHCDLVGLNPRSQQLLEHFFAVFGLPNAAEVALMARIGLVGVDVINKWFKEKQERVVQQMSGFEDEWYNEKVLHREYWRYKKPYSRF